MLFVVSIMYYIAAVELYMNMEHVRVCMQLKLVVMHYRRSVAASVTRHVCWIACLAEQTKLRNSEP